MPYLDKYKDRKWHKEYMRRKRDKLRLEGRVVTPQVTPVRPYKPKTTDADGNVIYEDY